MVRIKVIKASRLALFAAAVVLGLVLLAVLVGFITTNREEKPEYHINEAAIAVAASSNRVIVFDLPPENEHTDLDYEGFTIEVMPAPSPAPPARVGDAKRVLIYHTHTHEAYRQSPDDEYQEESPWRTSDERYSVVRVGDELAELLSGFGIEAHHDVTDHEPPKLGTAYARSLATLEKYAEQDFDLYIDLHRDAYDESMAHARAVSVGGADAARLMVLVGKGEGFDEKPDMAGNLAFAKRLTDKLNDMADGICRDVLVKVGRYNQHVGTPAILVEVGHNQNTLSEALASMPILAAALADILNDG